MKKILITSLHFSPAYIGIMEAWYKLCEFCGYKPLLYVSIEYKDYFDNTVFEYATSIDDVARFRPEYTVIQNNGVENLRFFRWCKSNNCKIIYILHEPYMGISELVKDGTYCIKQSGACLMNTLLCNLATKVILCSDYAEENCKKYMKGAYKKHVRFPLIFTDEFDKSNNVERKYFSLIGTYASSKGSDLFLNFIKDSVDKGYNINFQIATRSNIDKQLHNEIFEKLIRDDKLVVYQGKNMSTKEIDRAYRSSICCWNGYRRTTQSGVLPNAYMMGTPVVASELGSFKEFVKPNMNGEFINNNDSQSIYKAYCSIEENIVRMTEECRKSFLTKFYYANQSERFKRLIESIE